MNCGGGGGRQQRTKRLQLLATGAVQEQERDRQITRALSLMIRVLLRATGLEEASARVLVDGYLVWWW